MNNKKNEKEAGVGPFKKVLYKNTNFQTWGCRYWTVQKLDSSSGVASNICTLKKWKGQLVHKEGYISGSLPSACCKLLCVSFTLLGTVPVTDMSGFDQWRFFLNRLDRNDMYCRENCILGKGLQYISPPPILIYFHHQNFDIYWQIVCFTSISKIFFSLL